MGIPLSLTVKSTHFYLVPCRGGLLLIDAGWEWAQFRAQLKVAQISLEQIRFVMFTHHHPDHAGLVQEVKEQSGAKLIIHPAQIPFLETFLAYTGSKWGYKPIRVEQGDLIGPTTQGLREIGIEGEIVPTPGHSHDSVSLILSSGDAFIGDLPSPEYVDPDHLEECIASWKRMLALGARRFYHSHIGLMEGEKIQELVEGL